MNEKLTTMHHADNQKLSDDEILESEQAFTNRLFFIVLGLVIITTVFSLLYFLPKILDDSVTAESSQEVAHYLEEFRRAAICYDFSMDQVLDEHLSDYDESRLKLYRNNIWPKGLAISFLMGDPRKMRFRNADAHLHETATSRSYFFPSPLKKMVRVGGYQFLIFDKGIDESGAILVDSYAMIYCHGDMRGVINSQSYSSSIITGNVSGTIRNASYGHWIIQGDLSGSYVNECAGTLRILGQFDGAIQLWDRDASLSKVSIAGRTLQSALERITGAGIVYLEKSDLAPGRHQIGSLTVVVGDLSNENKQKMTNFLRSPPVDLQ